jgi:DNA topoisomerase-1
MVICLQPEDVTINIGKGAKVPSPPAGHSWKAVIHDHTVAWLAFWKEPINKGTKYVWLAAGSRIKGESDMKKFDVARKLKDKIGKIRKSYEADLADEDMAVRQRATALWIIDHLALRVGNEKEEDTADTVGCCSLRVEHLKLEAPDQVGLSLLPLVAYRCLHGHIR